jgi:hypothetical protein
MASYLREIAQGVADGLDAATFASVATQPTVERRNWARVDAADMADPVVFVTPGQADTQRISRGVTQVDYQVLVYIGRRVETEADADDMLDLADEILLYVRAHSWGEQVQFPEDVTSPQTVSIAINPDDALNERNVWRAVITASYRVFQADELPEA